MKKTAILLLLATLLAPIFSPRPSAAQAPIPSKGLSQVVPEKLLWVTMGEDAFRELSRTPGILSSSMVQLKSHASGADVVVTRFPARDVEAVSAFMHRKMKRCGGFIAHDSLADAVSTLKASSGGVYKALPVNFQIDQQSTVNAWLPLLDKNKIYDTIDHLSTNYTNRYYTYTSGRNAALWIRDLWQGYAGSRSDVSVTTYSHSGYTQPSVILTITGATSPSEIVVIGGHLDSIRSGGMSTGTSAPGADDNASGIATISEVIRVLMAQGFAPDRTMKFVGYAAEEVGLRGSGDIAGDHSSGGQNVVGVMQLDMTDYNGSVPDIALLDDYTNAELTAFVGNLIDEYQSALSWVYTSCGYACSDHASWHNQGFPAAMPSEAKFGEHNQQIHTSNDTLATLGYQTDHALKFAKLALSFAVETGVSSGGGGGSSGELSNGVPETGLSGSTGSWLQYYIDVPASATSLTVAITGGSGDADLYVRQGAEPTASSYDCRPWLWGNEETCTQDPVASGRWYVGIEVYESFSGLTLTATYVGASNSPPSAGFSSTTSGLTASFSDSSSDSDGTVVSRSWTFGDGGTSTSTNPSHTYSADGTYTVTLTVTDDDTATDSYTASVTVSGGGGGCGGLANTYTGSLSGAGDSDAHPNGTYFNWNGGTLEGVLSGPGGSDFDLRLKKWLSGSWQDVAASTSPDSEEVISYNGSAGYYYWQIESYSGSGSYTFCTDN